MIDLYEYEQRINRYGGSEEKRTYYKDGKFYLVKIPDRIRERNNSLSYMNNSFSEYISCNIFRLLGIPVQKTELSFLEVNNVKKVVCVCEDFTDDNHTLIEFCNLENEKENDSSNSKSKELELYNILEIITTNPNIKNKHEIIEEFWKVFIVDCLIFNKDRHNENWGFLENNKTGEIKFAPVYDCGSSLFALNSEDKCKELLNNPREFKNLSLNFCSAMKANGKRINYYEYITSLSNDDCNNALLQVFPKINLEEIDRFIDNIEILSDKYKEFYKILLQSSYDLILKPAYEKLIKKKK